MAHDSGQHYPALEQLICIALADQSLAAQLIADPTAALQCTTSTIQFSPVEIALATSVVGAADIHEFAARLYSAVQQLRTSIDTQSTEGI